MKTRTTLMLCVLAVLAFVWATPAQAALVAYWDCDEGSGTDLFDYTTNDNDGTLQNSMGWTSSGHTGLSGDNAIVGNGDASYVGVPDSATLKGGGSAFAITMWLNQSYSYNYADFLYTTDGSDRRWFLQEGTGDSYVWSDVDGAWQDGLGFTITDNSYHMYAFLYSGSKFYSYRDGVLLSTVNVGSTWPTFSDTLRIGGRGATWTSYEGSMDDISVWDADIGDAKVKTMYNITTVNSAALVDYTVDEMLALFTVYATGTPADVTTGNSGTLGWLKFTGGSGTAGEVTFDGDDYYAWFDNTSGVMTPEPATLALMGLGGLGLILRRKRK